MLNNNNTLPKPLPYVVIESLKDNTNVARPLDSHTQANNTHSNIIEILLTKMMVKPMDISSIMDQNRSIAVAKHNASNQQHY
jgi:hypothetical protein